MPDYKLNNKAVAMISEIVDATILDPFKEPFDYVPVLIGHPPSLGKSREVTMEIELHSRAVKLFNCGAENIWSHQIPEPVLVELMPAIEWLLERAETRKVWSNPPDVFVGRSMSPTHALHYVSPTIYA